MDLPDVPDALPAGGYAVYALVDPTDHLVYYVGQTRNPKKRLAGHLKRRSYPEKKVEWIRSLKEKGLKPLMQTLEAVSDEATALAKEQEWIRHFVEQGMPLLNAQVRLKPIRETGPLFPIPEKFSLDDLPKTGLLAAIYRHFYPEEEGQPMSEPQTGSTTQRPHKKLETVSNLTEDQLYRELETMREALGKMQRELPDFWQEREAEIKRLIEVAAELGRRDAIEASEQEGIIEPNWIPLLSRRHLNETRRLLLWLGRRTGQTQAQVEQEVLKKFNVPAINVIPDKRWPDVLAWALWRARQPDEKERSEPQ